MRVLLVFLLVSYCSAKIVTQDEIETLFKKFIHDDVSDSDQETLNAVIELLHQPEPLSRVGRSPTTTRNTLNCILCQSAFAALFEGVAIGQSDYQLTNTLTILCTSLGIETYNVCHGAVGLNMPVLTYIIKNTPEATPNSFCSHVLQSSTDPNVCRLQDIRFDWEVELPEYNRSAIQQSPKGELLKILVITDAHIDPLYEPYGVADCDESTCCRKGQRPRTSFTHQYFVDDDVLKRSVTKKDNSISLDLDVVESVREAKKLTQTRYGPRQSAPAGYWGDYRNCDTPIWAFDNALDEIASKHKDIDMVYYIGDTIDHFIWETTYELITEMNGYLVNRLKKTFGDIPMIPAIGNHESQPTNQFAPSTVTGPKINTTWLYDSLANKWADYLTPEAIDRLREMGAISMVVKPGLRVISLNNNVAYVTNWWLVYDPEDAKRHLEFLVRELHKAELAGETVHLIAHIPPGVHDLTYTWTREYNRIVNRFANTIASEFNGHTHSDEFKIFYNEDDAPVAVAWGAGGLTAHTNYNLNYKIVTVDEQYRTQDIQNYGYNLTEANLTPNRDPHWFQLYDMKTRYGLNDLTPASIHNLVQRMVTTDKHLLDVYAAFYSKLSDIRWPNCNENCKLNEICKTVVSVLWERERCEKLKELYYSKQ